MANIHWATDVNGYFGTGSNWVGGTYPGPSDNAILGNVGATPYTAKAGNETVNGIELAKTATLDLIGGNFTATDGTAGGANAGTIHAGGFASLTVGGRVDNRGVISLTVAADQSAGRLIIEAGGATLSGGGVVTMQGPAHYAGPTGIYGAAAGAILTNFDNTISGGGNIGATGSTQVTLINDVAGTIDALGALTVNAGGQTDVNAGLFEATAGGGLTLVGAVNNAGGTIFAADASGVTLQGADVLGGTLNTAGSGAITVAGGGNQLDGTTSAVSNQGHLAVKALGNGTASLTIQGAIGNAGAIAVTNAFQANANLIVGAAGATLSGGGTVSLAGGGSYNGVSQIYGAAAGATLTNLDNTISGNGNIGKTNNPFTLVNDAKGVIDATGGMTLNTGAATTTNAGLFEATAGGGLTLVGAVSNAGGTVFAADASGVTLQGADVLGGTLNTAGSGAITVAGGGNQLDGTTSAVSNQGNLAVKALGNSSVALALLGAIDNSGTIAMTAAFQANASLIVGAGGATLSGGGTVSLTRGGGGYYGTSQIYGAAAGAILTNFDNTISGGGNIGATGSTQVTLINDVAGTIDALGALTVNAGGQTDVNAGLFEATAGGGLTLVGAVNNAGGTISAGAGSTINLQDAQIIGGTLQGVVIQHAPVYGSSLVYASLLDGTASPVENQGLVEVVGDAYKSRASLTIAGAIDNIGTIGVTTVVGAADLIIGAGVTLSGGGTIVLAQGPGRYVPLPEIIGDAVGDTLTNFNNTISGTGNLGGGQLTLINDAGGVIDATGGLTLDTGSQSITNAGTIETSGGGAVTIMSAVNNTGGEIFAGAGSDLMVQGSTITGGRLGTAIGGTITLENGATATVDGTFANAGTIALASTGTTTALIFDKNSTLTGGGTVSLSANVKNTIEGTKASIVLTNVDNTITGSGQIGAGKLTLINDAAGVIDAKAPPALTINTGKNTITNAGLIETTLKGNLTVRSVVSNAGTIEADGGTLTLDAAVSGSGAVTIVAGTLDIANVGAMENVAFTGKTGKLELAQSQSYGGSVTGFSLTTKTSLDLRDIVFDTTTTESYSGTATSGTLTVTHGTAVANIHLNGNYLSSTFTLSSDGHGGTTVVDPPKAGAATAPPHAFIAAMAGLGAGAGMASHVTAEPWRAAVSMLAGPRVSMA